MHVRLHTVVAKRQTFVSGDTTLLLQHEGLTTFFQGSILAFGERGRGRSEGSQKEEGGGKSAGELHCGWLCWDICTCSRDERRCVCTSDV